MMTIGEIIRINREKQKISQEELSYGICSASNLSRIENGAQIPSRATYEALMERLGVEPEMYPSFLNNREVEAFKLKHQIMKKIVYEKYEEAEALIDKLDSGQTLERVYEQFILHARALLLRYKGGCPNEVHAGIRKAAELSVKDYSSENLLHHVLSTDDINVLNSLAVSFYTIGQEDKGIELLYALKEFIEKKIVDDGMISPMYTRILYNLSKWIGLRGYYQEVLKLCDIGILRCIEFGAYLCFAGLLLNKGYAFVMLGQKDIGKKYLQESFYINRARGEFVESEIVKNFANEHGIVL